MNHTDHVRLLRDGMHAPDGVWADLGSGHGAFTLALAELLSAQGLIYSVDLSVSALRAQQQLMQDRFPHVTVDYRVADFTQPLDLPALDGIVMANALHFVREKGTVLRLIRSCLKEHGHLILVEYDTDRGNHWVPYPLSYTTCEQVAERSGFVRTRRLHTVPSSFLGQFYSACSEKHGER
jgi:ubiquinone/menaquinone biosynthesis C-methylase UbiE